MGQLTLENSRNKFSNLAWLSAFLSLLAGLSHVRAFPSYNLALPLVALYASVQEEKAMLLKSITVCAIMGGLTILADILFCTLWAREIIDGYKGVMKFCLVVFIVNMFAKAALLYSAMAVAVDVNSEHCDESDDASENGLSSSVHSPKSPDVGHEERLTPARRFQSEVGDQGIDIPASPGTPGLSSLVSPMYAQRAPYSP